MLGNNFTGEVGWGSQEVDVVIAALQNTQEEVFLFEPGSAPGGDRGAF